LPSPFSDNRLRKIDKNQIKTAQPEVEFFAELHGQSTAIEVRTNILEGVVRILIASGAEFVNECKI
jgi:hypothetical protein